MSLGRRPARVLMASPPRSSAGGMSSVAEALAEECAAVTSWTCRLLDSGGGSGRLGYARFPRAAGIAAATDYDLLHLHVASKGSTLRKAALAEIAHRRHRPYVIHLHGAGYFDFLDAMGPRASVAVRQFYHRAAGVIVLGERWRQLIVKRLGVPQARVRIIHNGVPAVLAGRREGSCVDAGENSTLIAVGELSRRKGIDLLLSALENLFADERACGTRVALIGPTPEADIAERARRLAEFTGGRIELTGPLFGPDKQDWFASASALCLPSRAEALPMALLEAMSAGVPCITTDVGSIPEIFPHGPESGAIMLSTPTADNLLETLASIVAQPEERRRIGSAGRRRWESAFTSAAMFSHVRELWESILGPTA